MSFGDFTCTMELLVKGLWRTSFILKPNYADPKNIGEESIEAQLSNLSKQIVMVEETMMAGLKDGFVPRKLNEWLKKATYLKKHVSDTLKEKPKSKADSLDLKEISDKIHDNMKDCPIEDLDEKSTDFIAPMHETGSDDNGVQAQDVEEEVASSHHKKGSHAITFVSESGMLIFLESYGGGTPLKLTSKYRLTSENEAAAGAGAGAGAGADADAGESSQLHDVLILDISQDEKRLKLVEDKYKDEDEDEDEDDDALVMTRHGKMPIGATNPPQLPIEEGSSSSKHHDHQLRDVDDIGFERAGEAELGMIFPIVLEGSMSDITLQISSVSSTQETFDLNKDIGLPPDMDNYSFSATKEKDLESEEIVNPNGSMPTAEEWSRARVVNLIERRKLISLNDEGPNCPDLFILLLQRNSRLTHIPPSFFNQMPRLHFLDLSDTRIKDLPSSLFDLENLRVLLLRSCVSLTSLPANIKKLKNMQVLDLLGTDLSDLPKEIRELTQLRHLQLSFHQPGYGIEKGEVVSSRGIYHLQALQGLSIAVHPKDQHWARIVGDIIKQVVELKMLRYLQFSFPSVEALVSFTEGSLPWKERKLRRFNFVVGHNIKRIISRVPKEVESKYEEYDKCLRFVNSDELPDHAMNGILKSVSAFYLDHHLEIQSLSEFDISSFMELKFCVLRECPNIQIMIIGEKRDAVFFPKLEYLGLHYLWKLERIWEDDPTPGSYQGLKYLMISTCAKLDYIASHSVLQCLSNLEEFIVEDCESLRSIVKEDEMVKHAAALLPRLKKLELRYLPQLESLGRGLVLSKEIIFPKFCPKFNLTRPGHSRISEWKKLLGYHK